MQQEYRVVMYQPCEVRRSVIVSAESAEQAREIARSRVDMPEWATVLKTVGEASWESVNAVADDIDDEEELT